MAHTIADVLTDAYVEGKKVAGARRQGIEPARVLDGLKPKRPPAKEGLHLFTPEELLTLIVPTIEVNGRVTGYQREPDLAHARRIADAMLAGKPFPPMNIALDGRGRFYDPDGQHRALGGVIARVSVWGVVRKMDKREQAELFFGQRKAKAVDPNVLTLSGTGPFERYVQEAVSSSGNPWSDVASANRRSKTRIGPYTMYQLLIRYVGNLEGQATGRRGSIDERWDRGLADELAGLISCFGDKQTNPLAFRPATLQAIGSTAMWVFRRHERHPEDYERWQRHMPLFPFERYVHVRTQREMTDWLLVHWNKRLTGGRRVSR